MEEAQEPGLVNIEVLDHDDLIHHLEIPPDIGLNVMEACKANELPILGTCGGIALCGSCHVYVLSDHHLPEKSDEEREALALAHYQANGIGLFETGMAWWAPRGSLPPYEIIGRENLEERFDLKTRSIDQRALDHLAMLYP